MEDAAVYANPNDSPNAENHRDSVKVAFTRPNRFDVHPNDRQRIENVLSWILHKKSFNLWWVTPLSDFDHITPAQLATTGRVEELFEYVQTHMEPSFS